PHARRGVRILLDGPLRHEHARARLRMAARAGDAAGRHRVRGARALGAPPRGVQAHRRAWGRLDHHEHGASPGNETGSRLGLSLPTLYPGAIFRVQARGGITRYFGELIPRLRRPTRIVAGLHQSPAIQAGRLTAEASVYLRAFRLSPRPRAVVNGWVDAVHFRGDSGEIVHPTYYRDPAGIPTSLPMVLTVYDMAHELFPSLFRRRWWSSEDPARWKRAICRRADRIVCISESTRRDLVEILDVDERKTSVIHCGRTDWS